MSKMIPSAKQSVFSSRLLEYKQLIDQEIELYCSRLERETLQRFGANARLEIDAYTNILRRGGKRIRGALTMLAYEMSGGTDRQMILQAARAVEMIHAYILIIDDFQDRSHVRRGGPSAHTDLAHYHDAHELAGSSEHFGASVALNAALSGAHAAQQCLITLNVTDERKLQAISILNEAMIVTAHGQTTDIMNEVKADVSRQDIEQVLEWKTAHYTFLNPLSIGLVLAGNGEHEIERIREYALHAGKAFQITDDILGTFGTEFDSGKSPMDDIREGKRTLITEYALTHTNDDNQNFLLRMLGNTKLTPAQFERCKEILVSSGALAHADATATEHVKKAVDSLQHAPENWQREGIDFLKGLAQGLVGRTA